MAVAVVVGGAAVVVVVARVIRGGGGRGTCGNRTCFRLAGMWRSGRHGVKSRIGRKSSKSTR